MKKGIYRIVIGLILIILQVASIIGNSRMGIVVSPPMSLAQLIYDFVFYFSYYFIGIIGVVLLISGLLAFFGVRIIKPEAQPQSEGTDAPEDCSASKCRKCKKEIPAGSSFCPHCGKKVAPKNTAPLNKILLFAVFALSFLLVLSIISYSSIIHDQTDRISVLNSEVLALEAEIQALKADINDLIIEVETEYERGFAEGKNIYSPSYTSNKRSASEIRKKYGLD